MFNTPSFMRELKRGEEAAVTALLLLLLCLLLFWCLERFIGGPVKEPQHAES